MTQYLIAFNDEWVPDLTVEELRERGTSGRAVIEEMKAAEVFIFSDGGLDESTVVCSVNRSSGSPVFTDVPFVETKEHLGGFAVVDVPDDADARYWPAGSRSRSAGHRKCTASPYRSGIPCGSRLTRSPRPRPDRDVLVAMAWRAVTVGTADLTGVVVACTRDQPERSHGYELLSWPYDLAAVAADAPG